MTQNPPEQLADGNLFLRRWQTSDATALQAAANRSIAELSPWMPWAAKGYYSATDAQFYLAFTKTSWEAADEYDYAIIVDGQPSGSIGLMRPHRSCQKPNCFEIGYWLATDITGRGLATRATAMLIEVARKLATKHVQIRHAELNVRSSRIPLRLGFTNTGTHLMEVRGNPGQSTVRSLGAGSCLTNVGAQWQGGLCT
ncbi:hypothetical protein E4U21_004917 [Claviceps maximensis]|nr:hypothetical protein E4U21_004917 [Claviceps maximensis]